MIFNDSDQTFHIWNLSVALIFSKFVWWILHNLAKFYKLLAEFKWQQNLEIFQISRCNWNYFPCSKHLSKFTVLLSWISQRWVDIILVSVNYEKVIDQRSMCQWCNKYYLQAWKNGDGNIRRVNYLVLSMFSPKVNNLSMQQWKFLKNMYAKCLIFLCL